MAHSLDDAPTDEELLARLRRGDRELFGLLVRRYERELYGYLRRYLCDAELAEDVFQTTFAAVFVKIRQYEPGRPARPWLYTIATHQAIDALRRQKRRHERPVENLRVADDDSNGRTLFDLLPARDPDPVAHAQHEELAAQVRAAVDSLPELLRQVLILAYFQGMKYQEIAEVLEIPLGTVKSRLHGAIAKLTEVWTAANAGHTAENS